MSFETQDGDERGETQARSSKDELGQEVNVIQGDQDISTRSEERDHLTDALSDHFGFPRFQPGQREVIESVLDGHPTLAVMPTGAGKSLCYQLPAVMLEGVTLVVSPLISLMKDQVDALNERSISATYLNSTLSTSEQRDVIDGIDRGDYKLVYVAPERFQHHHFTSVLKRANLSLIAIDEAHCISRWGHNFRPHYARLGEHLAQLNPLRVMACTATATPQVSADIVTTLRFDSAHTHIAGFLRENLYLEARLCTSERSRQTQLEAFLEYILETYDTGAVIIYSTTVKRVEKYAQICVDALGIDQVAMYHGRLPNAQRDAAQERFMNGSARVVVATNAFGMGVDRADVRAVVHADLPGTLEGYYQEVGRAGRDRDPAHCLLLYMNSDARTHEFLINRSNPSAEHMQAVWSVVRERALSVAGPYSVELIEDAFQSSAEPLDTPLRHLKSADIVRSESWANTIEVNPNFIDVEEVQALPIDIDTLTHQRRHELHNLETVSNFARSAVCKHTHLLQYFGEGAEGPCPHDAQCDRCTPSAAAYISETQATGELGEDERRITLKALSGVARAKGIYGKTRVIEMLSGSRSAKLLQSFLKDLSTYGILEHLGADGCKELVGTLLGAGLCTTAPRILANGELSQYKSLQLTPQGLAVMSGKADPSFRLERHWVERERVEHAQSKARGESKSRASAGGARPKQSGGERGAWRASSGRGSTSGAGGSGWRNARSTTSSETNSGVGATPKTRTTTQGEATESEGSTLREVLRRYRLDQARLRSIPPFAVFPDAVLNSLIDSRPQTQRSFLAIRGLGPAKWANYGADVLNLIANHEH